MKNIDTFAAFSSASFRLVELCDRIAENTGGDEGIRCYGFTGLVDEILGDLKNELAID